MCKLDFLTFYAKNNRLESIRNLYGIYKNEFIDSVSRPTLATVSGTLESTESMESSKKSHQQNKNLKKKKFLFLKIFFYNYFFS